MSSSDDEEAAKSKISADGTFYDDEVSYMLYTSIKRHIIFLLNLWAHTLKNKLNFWIYSHIYLFIYVIVLINFLQVDTEPIKQGISDSMKARLMAEASTGLDSDKPQTNTILYIGVVVAVLVGLAGSGILY